MNKTSSVHPLPLLFLLFFSLASHAQTSIGLQVGTNLSGARVFDQTNQRQSIQMIPRFQIGLNLEVPLTERIFLQPALLYSGKGFKQKGAWIVDEDVSFKATASYLDLPILVNYKHALSPKGNLFIGAGAYAAYGLSGGKWSAETGSLLIGDIQIENHGKVHFGNDASESAFGEYLYGKPLDYGLSFQFGYQYLQRYSIQIQTQLGLANLRPGWGDEKPSDKFKTQIFGLSLGYKL